MALTLYSPAAAQQSAPDTAPSGRVWDFVSLPAALLLMVLALPFALAWGLSEHAIRRIERRAESPADRQVRRALDDLRKSSF